MISKRQKAWHTYAIVHSLIIGVFGLLSIIDSIKDDSTESAMLVSFAIGKVVIFGIWLIGGWVPYWVITSNDKNKLKKRVATVMNSELVKEEYRPKIQSLENLFKKGGIDSDKYYSHLSKLVTSAEKIINNHKAIKKREQLFNVQIENLKYSKESGLISEQEYELKIRKLEERNKFWRG